MPSSCVSVSVRSRAVSVRTKPKLRSRSATRRNVVSSDEYGGSKFYRFDELTKTRSSSNGASHASANAEEAKEWIDNWKQKKEEKRPVAVTATPPSSSSSAGSAGSDIEEVKAWIDSWKQKKGQKRPVATYATRPGASSYPSKNVEEAKAWIDNWKKREEKRPVTTFAAISGLPSDSSKDVKEAKAWIDNWKQKKRQEKAPVAAAATPSGASSDPTNNNVEDAKAWIANWKSKGKSNSSRSVAVTPKAASAEPESESSSSSGQGAGPLERIFRVIPDSVENNRSLWGVGLMQMMWTASTLMYVSILPIYMKQELGLSNTKIGVLEGAAVASAFFSKVFSGVISDALRSRTAVIFVGSMLTLACKPMFAASASIKASYGAAVCFYWIFSGKIADRLSKGIRAAPTDALLADLSPGTARSKAFSLCQSLATFGGVLGSSLTAALLFSGFSYETIFLLAAVPSALAIVVLFTAVKQPKLAEDEETEASTKKEAKSSSGGFGQVLKNAASLPWQFYFAALIVSTLYVARFSESFVVLRAKTLGWSTAALPLLLTSNQILQGFFTYPMGMLADNLGKKQILSLGFLALIVANAIFIYSKHPVGAVIGFLVVGLHMSMTQANTKALLTEYINPTQRGTAFAMFAVFSGFALSFGNTLAGILNDQSTKAGLGNIGCFYGGAIATTVSLVLLQVYFLVVQGKNSKQAST